jgi:hypothetical protein
MSADAAIRGAGFDFIGLSGGTCPCREWQRRHRPRPRMSDGVTRYPGYRFVLQRAFPGTIGAQWRGFAFVSGYSGGGRAGVEPASLVARSFLLSVSPCGERCFVLHVAKAVKAKQAENRLPDQTSWALGTTARPRPPDLSRTIAPCSLRQRQARRPPRRTRAEEVLGCWSRRVGLPAERDCDHQGWQ